MSENRCDKVGFPKKNSAVPSTTVEHCSMSAALCGQASGGISHLCSQAKFRAEVWMSTLTMGDNAYSEFISSAAGLYSWWLVVEPLLDVCLSAATNYMPRLAVPLTRSAHFIIS